MMEVDMRVNGTPLQESDKVKVSESGKMAAFTKATGSVTRQTDAADSFILMATTTWACG